MGEHHTGIAAGAEDRRAGHGSSRVRKRRVAEGPEGIGDGAKSQAEVGSGISIGDREHVDPIDFLPARRHPIGCREERAAQPWAVEIGDAGTHRRRLTPR